MAPGCGVPATGCRLDHTIPWENGGHTAVDNLAPLCQGNHTVKHHGGWQVEHSPTPAEPFNGPHPPDGPTAPTGNDTRPSSTPTPTTDPHHPSDG